MLEQSPRPFLIGLDFSSQVIQREQQFFESLPQRRQATGHSCFRLGFGTDVHPCKVVQVTFCQLQAWALRLFHFLSRGHTQSPLFYFHLCSVIVCMWRSMCVHIRVCMQMCACRRQSLPSGGSLQRASAWFLDRVSHQDLKLMIRSGQTAAELQGLAYLLPPQGHGYDDTPPWLC